jgi:hypothetical protein
MRLGLVTNAPNPMDTGGSSSEPQDFEWEDFASSDEEDANEEGGLPVGEEPGEEYHLSTKRRSSVDLDSMTENAHDHPLTAAEIQAATTTGGYHAYDFESNKRLRSKQPSISSIDEGPAEDEEIETVDGDDEDVELRDAEGS